jgi:phage shock protein A
MTTETPDAERLDQIDERIDKARARAEDLGILTDEQEEEFADSGATPEADDQTIAPPG